MSKQHPLLCAALNPASVPLVAFARSRTWLAVHAVAQCIARLLMDHEQGRKQDLEEDLLFMRSLAQMNMEERWKIMEYEPFSLRFLLTSDTVFFRPTSLKPDHAIWRTPYDLTQQAFLEPSNPRDKKQLSKVLRKPIPEDLQKFLFEYDSYLHLLSCMGLSEFSFSQSVSSRHLNALFHRPGGPRGALRLALTSKPLVQPKRLCQTF